MISRKKTVALAMVLIILFSLNGCTKITQVKKTNHTETLQMSKVNGKITPQKYTDNYGTTYEIFLSSFYDSNGDGIGDIQGLIHKLDYINDGDEKSDKDLGCDGIWLTPVCPSPSYHKYDITDYEAIDPAFGTMKDYEELIKECHKRKIKLYYDMVMNHTSVQHPWFLQAAAYLKTLKENEKPDASVCPYVDYYNFSTEKKDGYTALAGTRWFYEARFSANMPDLNLDNPAVEQQFKDIAAFWLNKGVDGFRMDAALFYYTGDDAANIRTLSWFNDAVKKIKPDAYIVAEVWTNSGTYSQYYQSGIDSLFDFSFADSSGLIAKVVRGSAKASDYTQSLLNIQTKIQTNSKAGIDAPFYTNHDIARSAGYYSGDHKEDRTKIAGALNLLMSGNAFVYYGEELGMKGSGKDENKRAPMYWNEDKDSKGMCTGPTNMDNIPMLYKSLEKQTKDPLSIYNYYKQAIRLRNNFPVIARGTVTELSDLESDSIAAFTKTADADDNCGKNVCIIINTSEKKQTISLDSIKYHTLKGVLTTSKTEVKLKDKQLALPPFAIAVLTEK